MMMKQARLINYIKCESKQKPLNQLSKTIDKTIGILKM